MSHNGDLYPKDPQPQISRKAKRYVKRAENCLQDLLTEFFKSHNFSEQTHDWTISTQNRYALLNKQWINFCRKKKLITFEKEFMLRACTLRTKLILASRYQAHCSYGTIKRHLLQGLSPDDAAIQIIADENYSIIKS